MFLTKFIPSYESSVNKTNNRLNKANKGKTLPHNNARKSETIVMSSLSARETL